MQPLLSIDRVALVTNAVLFSQSRCLECQRQTANGKFQTVLVSSFSVISYSFQGCPFVPVYDFLNELRMSFRFSSAHGGPIPVFSFPFLCLFVLLFFLRARSHYF